MLKGGARGGVMEGFTEAAQEGTGYTASAAMSEGGLEENFNTNEFTNLLAQSAVAGASLGTSFGIAGQAIEAGDRFAMQRGLMRGNTDRVNEFERLALELNEDKSVDDITKALQKKTDGKGGGLKSAQLAEKGEKNRGSFWDKVKNPAQFLPELYRAAGTSGFTPEVLRKSEAARQLRALTGQVFGNIYSGRDVSAKENQVRSRLLNTINPSRIFTRFGMMDRVSNSNKISDMIRRYMVAKGDKRKLRNDKEVLENYEAIKATIEELRAYHQASASIKDATYISQDSSRINQRLPFDPDGWLTNRQWDWSKVRNNREAWYAWMRKNAVTNKGNQIYTDKELDDLFNKISNNETSTDFSIVEGAEFIPGMTKGSTQQLALLPGFDQFANNDIIQNAIFDVNQTARYNAYTTYFGAGGKYLDELFEQMEREGLSEDEIANIAYFTKSIIDSGTGNYKNIKNRKVLAFQRAGSFYATVVGLPMAAISSFPEFVMLLYQGRGANDIQNAVNSFTGQLVGALKDVANMKLNPALANVPGAPIYRNATQQLIEAGLFPDDATVATRYGLGETDISKAWYQKTFFKYSLITGVTQLQRSMAAAAVDGFVSDRVRILLARKEDVPMNQDQMEIYLQLQNLGMDVDGYLEAQRALNMPDRDSNGLTIYDKYMDESNNDPDIVQLRDFVDDQLNTVTWYFVNDRIQNPQAYNRPLFFQDPHFQLLVQFNGFISTFTANIVPKLWNDYIKKGSPRMKYNTFALLVTMMGVGGASQWLKDFLKFGKSTPYLNDAQLVQRAIMSSGVLGTGERLVQAVAPLYSSRDEGIVQRLFGETLGGAPTVRLADTARKAVVEAAEGDYEGFLRNTAKLLPGVAPFTPARNAFTALLQGEKPTGYPFDNIGE
jgi:hypothetical protein